MDTGLTADRARLAPSLVDFVLEGPRAVFDFQRCLVAWPWLRLAPEGDGHPVLVLPGFLANDASTVTVRRFLRRLGYPAYRWRLGRNLGSTDAVSAGLVHSLERLTEMHSRRLSLLGWSLGGVIARELARVHPDLVRQVITLGTSAGLDAAPPVPSTSIYSRRDGIVAWQTCVQEIGDVSENIEVGGGHLGLGHNPAVLLAISDRLAQPETAWRPFRPPAGLRHWYRSPSPA